MRLEYPKIAGYHWNLLQKISIALGLPEDAIYTAGTETHTIIVFNADITPEQKLIVDSIVMATNPCLPPSNTGNTTYRVVDIWSMRQWFYGQIGITPVMWFEEGNPDGSGECYMYLQFSRPLTKPERDKIVRTYAGMIGEWVM